MFKSREQRITERILEIRKAQEKKTPKKVVKTVRRKNKVGTSAQKKTNQMLKIIDNKSLKAGERLEKVMVLLKKAPLVESDAFNHKPIH